MAKRYIMPWQRPCVILYACENIVFFPSVSNESNLDGGIMVFSCRKRKLHTPSLSLSLALSLSLSLSLTHIYYHHRHLESHLGYRYRYRYTGTRSGTGKHLILHHSVSSYYSRLRHT